MIYSTLRSRKHIIWFFTAILIALTLFYLLKIRIVNNALVFIPDSEIFLKEASRAISESPAGNILFVDIEGENPTTVVSLIENAIPSDLAYPIDRGVRNITPESLIRAFPLLFTPELETRLNKINLDTVMEANKQLLSGFGSITASEWVRTDPLQLRLILRDLLPTDMPLFHGSASSDGRHALLMLIPTGGAFSTDTSKKIIQTINENIPSGYTLMLSGAPAHTAANAETIENDIFRILFGSLVGFAAAYIFLARSWGACWILATAIIATIIAIALTGIIWPYASGIAIGFGSSLMGLAEDYAVHMHFALRSGSDQQNIYYELLTPLLQSFILNSSGFFVLLFSAIPAIRQMAFFATISLSIGFFMATVVLPFLPGFNKPENVICKLSVPKSKSSSIRSVIVCLFLISLCTILYFRQDFNFTPAALGAQGEKIAENTKKIREIWGLESKFNIILRGNSKEDALRKTATLTSKLRAAGATEVLSVSDFIFSRDDQVKNSERWYRWIDNINLRQRIIDAGAKYGFGINAFKPFFDALLEPPQALKWPTDLLFFDNSTIIRCDTLPNNFDFNDDALVFKPDNIEALISKKFDEEKKLVAIDIIILIGLVWILLRQWPRIMAVSIPVLFSVTIIFIIFDIMKLQFNLAAMAALPIVFGLAIDHGIMITHSLDSRESLGVRRAISLASITAFFSIGLLALSDHPALRSMGIVIFSGLVGEFFAAIWLVPSVYPRTRSHT